MTGQDGVANRASAPSVAAEARGARRLGGRRCPVCCGVDVRPSLFGGHRYAGSRYDIVRCRGCGLYLVDPLPTDELLMAVYTGPEYFDDYVTPGGGTTGYVDSFAAPDEFDDMVLREIGCRQAGGRLLDIGCAGGRFLARGRDAGYEVFGVEPNSAMAEHAARALGLDVWCGALEALPERFAPGSFDVVHLGDVLEHLRDLEGTFAQIHRLLRPRGLLVLQQPMTYNRTLFNALLRVNMWLKRDRHSTFPPLHLWEFTPRSLRRILIDRGFEILHMRTFERRPPAPADAAPASLKKRLGPLVKRASCAVSNASWLRALELGDRAFVICRKTS